MGKNGQPVEYFLFDPPMALPEGIRAEDLINKATLWQHPDSEVWHVLLWIGKEYYPYLPDYVEEVRRFGVSRKVSSMLDFSKLTPNASMMIMAHPHARLESWMDRQRPDRCRKLIAGHARADKEVAGPCLFKCWDLVPAEAGTPATDLEALGEEFAGAYQRTVAATTYTYKPTGESSQGLVAGLFGAFPIHGISLVRGADGTVNEEKAAKLEKSSMPWEVADE